MKHHIRKILFYLFLTLILGCLGYFFYSLFFGDLKLVLKDYEARPLKTGMDTISAYRNFEAGDTATNAEGFKYIIIRKLK